MPVIVSTNCTITSAALSRTLLVGLRRLGAEPPHQHAPESGTRTGTSGRAGRRARPAAPTCRPSVRTAVIRPSNPVSQHVLDGLDVVGRAADHPAGGVAVVERDVETLEVPEDPAAQLEQHLLADPARAAQEEHPADGLHQHHAAQRADDQSAVRARSRRRRSAGCRGRCRAAPAAAPTVARRSPPRRRSPAARPPCAYGRSSDAQQGARLAAARDRLVDGQVVVVVRRRPRPRQSVVAHRLLPASDASRVALAPSVGRLVLLAVQVLEPAAVLVVLPVAVALGVRRRVRRRRPADSGTRGASASSSACVPTRVMVPPLEQCDAVGEQHRRRPVGDDDAGHRRAAPGAAPR